MTDDRYSVFVIGIPIIFIVKFITREECKLLGFYC